MCSLFHVLTGTTKSLFDTSFLNQSLVYIWRQIICAYDAAIIFFGLFTLLSTTLVADKIQNAITGKVQQ